MRIEPLRRSTVVDDAALWSRTVMRLDLRQHPARGSNHGRGPIKAALHGFAVPVKPGGTRRFIAMDRNPPAHDIAVGYYDLGDIDIEGAVAELVQVENVRRGLTNYIQQVLRRGLNVFGRVLHPFEAKSSGTEVNIAQRLDPHQLPRLGNMTEADQRYLDSAANQASDKFTGVGPDAADGIRCN